jgi:hypothetical protein
MPDKPSHTSAIRAWAQTQGYTVSAKGRLPSKIRKAYIKAVSRREVDVAVPAREANHPEITAAPATFSLETKVVEEQQAQADTPAFNRDALSQGPVPLDERSQFDRSIALEEVIQKVREFERQNPSIEVSLTIRVRRSSMTLQEIKERITEIKMLKETLSNPTHARQAKRRLYREVLAAIVEDGPDSDQSRAFASGAFQAEKIVPN